MMKYNNVKEITDEIEKEVHAELSFEQTLMKAYPILFRKDDNGNVLKSECGVSCPVGWQSLVTSLCECIASYITNSEILTPKHMWWFDIKMSFYKNVVSPILDVIFRKVDPYELYRPESPSKKYTSWLIHPHIREKVETQHAQRLSLANKIRSIGEWFRPHYKYNRQQIPPLTIDQIKEKFGTLRFYYEGGNDVIKGMIRLAEHQSAITCQVTGEPGSLHKKSKGMAWYKTLSPAQAIKDKYEKYNYNVNVIATAIMLLSCWSFYP